MKTLELSKAVKSLASYAADAQSGPVLVTRYGKPLAAVISMAGIDRESLALSTHPKFIALIERSRASRPGDPFRRRDAQASGAWTGKATDEWAARKLHAIGAWSMD